MRKQQPDAGLQHKRDPYAGFYAALGVLREEFHRIGRFDDANAKLDEVCRLLALRVLDARHPPANRPSRFSVEYLSGIALRNHGDARRLAAALHDVFSVMAAQFPDELQAFGPQRGLGIHRDDDEFAAAIVRLVECLPDLENSNGFKWSFDGLNEAFGHFVQDSFRNRKEDAQYMTPPEVVSMMVEIAFGDILRDATRGTREEPIVVADPTCGVGSFLAAAYRHACHVGRRRRGLAGRLRLFGQDKVERMVRLASVNLRLFAEAPAQVRLGNSILPPGLPDDLQGEVDLVITNPPFGATFASGELLKAGTQRQFPVLFAMAEAKALPKALDSEYILLDRELALLKPGGRLLMVVPDHVVSAGGFSRQFRLGLLQCADLVGVFDLPTETFAQAGTRTKTSVVYLQRHGGRSPRRGRRQVFMAAAEDLGFRVVCRNGASIKRMAGRNDLEEIVRLYQAFRGAKAPAEPVVCLNWRPSVAAVAGDQLLNNRWTAGFYQADRLAALRQIAVCSSRDFRGCPLLDATALVHDSSERVFADEGNRCISVLHVREDGCIDLRAVEQYRPATACIRCEPGDVLMSKINPWIPRVCVVPRLPWKTGCSSEFAVLRCRLPGLTPWMLMLLLRSEVVQAQIRTLTSGTSSSHNRIKSRDLASIIVPAPCVGSATAAELADIAMEVERATMQQYEAMRTILGGLLRVGDLLVPGVGS